MIRSKFGRKKTHREMMLKNLATSIILYERVQTTLAKAKAVRSLVEQCINLGKKKDLAGRRTLLSILKHKNAVDKILEKLADRYHDRPGGYLKIYKCGFRAGDSAPLAIIQLIPAQGSASAVSQATDDISSVSKNTPKK